jgi:hypothetical protein
MIGNDWFSAAAPPEEAPASLCLSHALEHAAACRTDWSYGIAEPHVCYTLSHHATATSHFHIKLLAKGHRTVTAAGALPAPRWLTDCAPGLTQATTTHQ